MGRPVEVGTGAKGPPDDELYKRRIVRLFAVLLAYGVGALAFDLLRASELEWAAHQVHWPRFMALAVVLPITAAGASGMLGARSLRWVEPFVYLLVIAEVSAETVLSRAPLFEVDELAAVILFLRACFIPSTVRAHTLVGLLVTAAVAVSAWVHLDVNGGPLTPLLAHADGQEHFAFQTANVVISMLMYVAITAYVTHSIDALRERARGAAHLGQYVLEEKIGEGAMGEVWRAEHALLQRPTAIKLIRGNVGEVAAARFEREVRAASRLRHGNIVAVYDFGRADRDRVFYAMELLEGLTLQALVDRHGPMPAARALRFLDQLLGALDEAHRLGVVHRDVKPANVMVTRNGSDRDYLKLLDFGLVHLRRRKDDMARRLTSTGAITGTPLYMPPEIITGEGEPDGRTDLYSLGAVAYFLLTGQAPFEGTSATHVLLAHVQTTPTPPSARSEMPIGGDVDSLVLRALGKKPEERFSTAAEMRAALRACDCYGEWTDEKAAEWWSVHGSTRAA
jgi:eukaryotic-like serine/threonine-protein kinase